MSERLIIVDEVAHSYFKEITDRFPNLDAVACSSETELAEQLKSFAPTIAYSCVSHGFPRHQHRPLIDVNTLRWLHVGGSGFEHFSGFDADQLQVTNGRGVLAPFLADTIIGALISLNFGMLDYHRQQVDGRYQAHTHPALPGKRLLVIGPGAIGSELATKARAFGLVCDAVARRPQPMPAFDRVVGMDKLGDLLREADFVSVHVPLTSSTRNLISADELVLLKPSAILFNCARGGVVDQTALYQSLSSGGLRAAYLDVFEQEPLASDNPLRFLPNILLTPHCSDQVDDWQVRHSRFFMENLQLWLAGKPLANVVS